MVRNNRKQSGLFFPGATYAADREGRGGCRESLRDEGDRGEDVKGEISRMQTRWGELEGLQQGGGPVLA